MADKLLMLLKADRPLSAIGGHSLLRIVESPLMAVSGLSAFRRNARLADAHCRGCLTFLTITDIRCAARLRRGTFKDASSPPSPSCF
jgi:hypothetical protein